jgi:peptidoglycan/LPS O-acetylase OafA/YrhL
MMGALQVLFSLYATVLPFAILGAWMAVSLWDLARREDLGRGAAIGWSAAVLVVPVVGAAGYLLSSRTLPTWLGVTYVVGGLAAYLVVVGLTAAVGGMA